MEKLKSLFILAFFCFSSFFSPPFTPAASFPEIEAAACALYSRMQLDVDSGACPDDACLRDVIKPKRVCEWRIEGVEASCLAGDFDQARTRLLAAYNPTRNHIGQMLDHCRDGKSNCALVASYIGGEFLDEFYLTQDYPDCPYSFSCIRDELWAFGDSNPPLLGPFGEGQNPGANDLNLMGWMKERLNQVNVWEGE